LHLALNIKVQSHLVTTIILNLKYNQAAGYSTKTYLLSLPYPKSLAYLGFQHLNNIVNTEQKCSSQNTFLT
jgi:hypothetical protein